MYPHGFQVMVHIGLASAGGRDWEKWVGFSVGGLEEVTLLVQLGKMRPGPSHEASAGSSSASIEEEENHPVWCFLRAGEDFLARRVYSHVSETAKQSG